MSRTVVTITDDQNNVTREITVDDSSGQPRLVDMRIIPHAGVDPLTIPFLADTLQLLQRVGAGGLATVVNGNSPAALDGPPAASPPAPAQRSTIEDDERPPIGPSGRQWTRATIERYAEADRKAKSDPDRMAGILGVAKMTVIKTVAQLRQDGHLPEPVAAS